MANSNQTFDIQFHSSDSSNSKGFSKSKEFCIDYINQHNGTNYSYFEDYKGGVVQVVCNETSEVVFEAEVK